MTGCDAHLKRIGLATALKEVVRGVGTSWRNYRVVGVTRSGIAPAKENVGKHPERYKLVEPGTVFYNPMRILLGSIAMVDEGDEPGITSPDYVVLKTQPGILHPRWFYYWLRSPSGHQFIRSLTRGAVRERMLFRRLAAADLDVPEWAEQVRAASELAGVEQARKASEEQLAAANALPNAYLRLILEGEEAQKWPRVPLGNILVRPLRTGISGPITPSSPWVCLMLSAVRGDYLDLNETKPVGITDKQAEAGRLRPGLFYVVRGNGNRALVGRGAYAPSVVSPHLLYPDLLIEVDTDPNVMLPRFLTWLWDSRQVRTDIEARARTSAGIYKINQANLAQVILRVPPLPEQARIAAKLDERLVSVERSRAALVAQVEALNALRIAVLGRAYTGRA